MLPGGRVSAFGRPGGADMAKTPTIAGRDWSTQPPYISPGYRSTPLRGPKKKLVPLVHTLSELASPVYGHDRIGELDHDLTKNARVNGEPLGFFG